NLVAIKQFRDDLAVRLSGFTIRVPPLRERREDFGFLIATLVRRLAASPEQVAFHPEAVRIFLRYSWPGNVRELEKRLGAALVLAGDGPVNPTHLGEFTSAEMEHVAPLRAPSEITLTRKAELERLLAEHNGNLAAVSRALGKDRVQVRRWLRRYG